MRKWSTSVQRRQRENERGVVSPSPVGEAIVNEVRHELVDNAVIAFAPLVSRRD